MKLRKYILNGLLAACLTLCAMATVGGVASYKAGFSVRANWNSSDAEQERYLECVLKLSFSHGHSETDDGTGELYEAQVIFGMNLVTDFQ